MGVKIKYPYIYQDVISVTINGACNHASAEERVLEFAVESWFADAARWALDDSVEEAVMYCEHCKHYQDEQGRWHKDEAL